MWMRFRRARLRLRIPIEIQNYFYSISADVLTFHSLADRSNSEPHSCR
jgi:hypothetical protein